MHLVFWDPYQQVHINSLEKIQKRSARWVCNNYSTYSSVTTMLESLNWATLREHRKIARLSFFHNIVYKASVVNIPQHFLRITRHTTHFILSTQAQTLQHIETATSQELWNSLSTSLIEMTYKKLFLDNICG